MNNNNKEPRLSKSRLSEIFTEHFCRPKHISIIGNVVNFHIGDRKKIVGIISFRTPDQFSPRPEFVFSHEHLENAKAVLAGFTICVCQSDFKQIVIVDHRNDLLYLRDEYGDICGIYGLVPADDLKNLKHENN